MRSVWNVGDWGDACGPRPRGGGAPAGMATIAQQGGELVIQGPSRSYSTSHCWEQFPGMRIVSHSGGKRGWRTICKTGAGDPRQATVTTNIIATDTHINFDEVGQYQFVVKKQNCTASVRRSRTFKLVQREGEPVAAEQPPPPDTTEKPPEPKPAEEKPKTAEPEPPRAPSPPNSACRAPGPPVRLEVRPAQKLIRSGEDFGFRSTVLDANGCVLGLDPTWDIVDGGNSVKLVGPGRVVVAEDASEGNVELRASVGGKSATVRLQIVSPEHYGELLESEAFDAQGESKGAAVVVIASGGIGAGKAVSEKNDRRTKLLVLVGLSLVAMALAIVGLVLARRSKQALKPRQSPVEENEEPPASRMVCPTCGQDYPSDRGFCPNDGNRLVQAEPPATLPGVDLPQGGVCPTCAQGYDPGVERCPEHGELLVPPAVYLASRSPQPSRKICPLCGTQYRGDAEFCGQDGAQLVPVN